MSTISVPSFAKINLGLKIGPRRPDGFHELRTIYQTLALHDTIRVEVVNGAGIEIRCSDNRVPLDSSNTCHKVAERVLNATGFRVRVVIEIEKRLPVQGGLGAASANAVSTLLGLESALGIALPAGEKFRIAAEVGSDLPLFLVGGTVLGVGRGEEVFAIPDFPTLNAVIVTPGTGVSTPRAFVRWDELNSPEAELTRSSQAGTINEFSQRVFAWLSASFPVSGVPAGGGNRAETLLLDLVRAGIENDFEQVVFPEYPDLREVKALLQREGAVYASLSGSGSTLYGIFATEQQAQAAAARMSAAGHAALTTRTLTRAEYWRQLAIST